LPSPRSSCGIVVVINAERAEAASVPKVPMKTAIA
jgi:hypothetical protein